MADSFCDLEEWEELLEDLSEEYYRLCPQGTWDEENNQPSDTMFWCNKNDNGMLSGARQKKNNPAALHDYRTRVVERATRGVWAVTVAEVIDAGTRIVDDSGKPLPEPPPPAKFIPPPGHSYIDQRPLDSDERQEIRSALLLAATNRRRLYPPETEESPGTATIAVDVPVA